MGVAERRQKLRSQYFFDCDCPPCERERQRPSAGPGQEAFRCHRCRALLQVNLFLPFLLFSWLFWDISYPAERPEIFSRMLLGLGDAESHTVSSPHLDHPLQEPQGRVGIHALSCKEQKIPPKLSQGCSSKSRGSPRLSVLQIHCSPGAQKCHQDPVFLSARSAPFSLLFSPISERLPPCSGQMAAFSPSLRPSQSRRIKTYRPLTEIWAKIVLCFINPIPVAGGKSEAQSFPPAIWARGMGHIRAACSPLSSQALTEEGGGRTLRRS